MPHYHGLILSKFQRQAGFHKTSVSGVHFFQQGGLKQNDTEFLTHFLQTTWWKHDDSSLINRHHTICQSAMTDQDLKKKKMTTYVQ